MISGRGRVHWLYDVSLVCCVARVCCFVTLAEDVCHHCCGGSGSCGCLQRHVSIHNGHDACDDRCVCVMCIQFPTCMWQSIGHELVNTNQYVL